ncbi:MAG: cytochrome C [Pirellulales bacterium]|nr:cytochrome C [Pirellulales bacterium]
MRPRAQLLPNPIALRAAALAVVGAAAAYLLVPDASRLPSVDAQAWTAAEASSARLSAVATPVVDDRRAMSTKVQSLLAEGGCPGWIAVANHPEWLEPTTDDAEHGGAAPPANLVPPGAVRLASERRSDAVPRVKYPVPLRLAARPSAEIAGEDDELLAAGEDLLAEEDDLLDGADDLVPLPPVDDPPAPRSVSPVASQAALSGNDDDLLAPGEDLLLPTPNERPAATPRHKPATPAPPKSAADSSDDDLLTDQDDLLTPPVPLPPVAEQRQPQASPTPTLPPPENRGAPVAPTPPGPPTGSAFAHPPANVPNPHAGSKPAAPQTPLERCEFVAQSRYPAATECRACHEQIYDEWAMSSHAYAFVSPMFHKFEQKINDVAQGTIGYFCYRCHSPAGTELGISRAAPLWELPQVAREGVTCVACHRVNEFYGRTNGERRIVPGDVYDPVYGTIGGHGVAEAIARKDDLKLKTSPDEKGPGQPIHTAGFYNPQLATSDFCITCHQVAVFPGIKLEVVWEQYRASPACQKGIRCQDCHMGRIPGVPSGFEVGPAAVVNKKNVGENRKHSNHVFYGPGYSIAHPGIFPFNPKAYRWTMREWLLFDWRAGWGTEEFEDAVDAGRIHVVFPAEWKESDDRCDAREIIEDNLKRRAKKDQLRLAVMENGSHVDGPFFKRQPVRGQPLEFEFIVANTNEGHNLPTASLGAQPQLWANVVLIGPRGNRLWESGYLDSLGDLADIHSVDVRRKRLAFDAQLFNLQTMFLITGAKGTDREFFLPVNVDIDQLPFIRPGAQPISVINHPPFIRMEARSLPPLGSRRVPYKVPAELMCEPGHYRLSFRMRSRLEPLYFMRFCDATPEMQRAMTEGILDFHESSMEFFVP